jgi:hypothetical protein
LIDRLKAELPEIPVNTIRGSLVGLADCKPQYVYRLARGLFQHAKYRESGDSTAGEMSAVGAFGIIGLLAHRMSHLDD